MQIRSFRARRRGDGDGRMRPRLRQEHQLGHLHRRDRRRCPRAARSTGTPSSCRSTRPRSPARTSSGSCPSGAARKVAASGSRARQETPATRGRSRPRSVYFLEEKYPAYGNIVPRDIATREIFDICVNQGMGVGGENQVYLDLTHLDRDYLERKLGGIVEIYRKFVGEDPAEVPMRIFPGVHYSMGGLWTTYTPRTTFEA